jgi:hypothetical protein
MQSYFQKVIRVHNTCKSWSTVETQDADQRSFFATAKTCSSTQEENSWLFIAANRIKVYKRFEPGNS